MTATNVSGAGIMLMANSYPVVSLAATNPVSTLIEELQFTLGEGPCVDAYCQTNPIAENDLSGAGARWPAFTRSALDAGVRAIFGFPISVGPVCIGALSLYRDCPGSLTDDQRRSALAVAALAGRRIIALQTHAEVGEVAAEFSPMLQRCEAVHQATGMVSVQLGVSVASALLCLRARAFANDSGLTELSGDVVARRLRFAPECEE